jgi:hypothetical protein
MGITYCSRTNCQKMSCEYHQHGAPKGVDISIADRDNGCFVAPYSKRKELLIAICNGTQKTNYRCSDACKALCDVEGGCAYCSIIADAVEEMLNSDGAGETFV